MRLDNFLEEKIGKTSSDIIIAVFFRSVSQGRRTKSKRK